MYHRERVEEKKKYARKMTYLPASIETSDDICLLNDFRELKKVDHKARIPSVESKESRNKKRGIIACLDRNHGRYPHSRSNMFSPLPHTAQYKVMHTASHHTNHTHAHAHHAMDCRLKRKNVVYITAND